MRFLIDEDVPKLMIDWLKGTGHDLLLAGELAPGQEDRHWLRQAEADERIIVTADKDFGELIFRDRLNSHGIVLLRLFDMVLADRLTRLQETWSIVESNPSRRFIVITSKRVRVRKLN
jgi:predicted nuclease of predicted toxin-antitoxin system